MSGIRMFCSCGAWEMSEKKRSKPQGIQRKLGLDLWGWTVLWKWYSYFPPDIKLSDMTFLEKHHIVSISEESYLLFAFCFMSVDKDNNQKLTNHFWICFAFRSLKFRLFSTVRRSKPFVPKRPATLWYPFSRCVSVCVWVCLKLVTLQRLTL